MKKSHEEIIKMNQNYYNRNADSYITDTMDVDMTDIYDVFEKYVSKGSKVLDLGFGSGRDTLHFLNKGYEVVSIDFSKELVKRAKKIMPNEVRLLDFHYLDYNAEFDAIWACASLLHSSESALRPVLNRCIKALKANGILYMSLKKGKGILFSDSRSFLCVEAFLMEEIFNDIEGLVIKELWVTEDARCNKYDKWVNIIINKLPLG